MTAATGEVLAKIAKRYRHFAHFEAHGVSPTYEAWALAVADDLPARRFLAALPREKQQPNLLFAAVRWLTPDVGDTSMFLDVLGSRGEEISRIMMSRIAADERFIQTDVCELVSVEFQPEETWPS